MAEVELAESRSDLYSQYTEQPSEANVSMSEFLQNQIDAHNDVSLKDASVKQPLVIDAVYGILSDTEDVSIYSQKPSETNVTLSGVDIDLSIYSDHEMDTVYIDEIDEPIQYDPRDSAKLMDVEEEKLFGMELESGFARVVDSNECLARINTFKPIPVFFNSQHFLAPANQK